MLGWRGMNAKCNVTGEKCVLVSSIIGKIDVT